MTQPDLAYIVAYAMAVEQWAHTLREVAHQVIDLMAENEKLRSELYALKEKLQARHADKD